MEAGGGRAPRTPVTAHLARAGWGLGAHRSVHPRRRPRSRGAGPLAAWVAVAFLASPSPASLTPASAQGPPGSRAGTEPAEDAAVTALVGDAREAGDALRGAAVFASAEAACLGCHRIGEHGGSVGPDLSRIGGECSDEELAVALL